MHTADLQEALETLGTLLEARGLGYDIVLIGGGALLLLGLIAGPTDLLRFGLPEGFAERVVVRQYGSLTVRLAARVDQIALKLYAAVDQGPRSKHFQDLRQLHPAPGELRAAARWCRTHDTSEAFADMLEQALARFQAGSSDV